MKKIILIFLCLVFFETQAQQTTSHVVRLDSNTGFIQDRTITNIQPLHTTQSNVGIQGIDVNTYNLDLRQDQRLNIQPLNTVNNFQNQHQTHAHTVYQQGFNDGQQTSKKSVLGQIFEGVLLDGFAYAKSQWRDGRFVNPVVYLPANMRYQPQIHFYQDMPTYIGRGSSRAANDLARTRYWNNYNGGQPVYTLQANPPIASFGWGRFYY